MPDSNWGCTVAAGRLHPLSGPGSGVGWSAVVVGLPGTGNLWSFPFNGSVQARKGFFVKNGKEALTVSPGGKNSL